MHLELHEPYDKDLFFRDVLVLDSRQISLYVSVLSWLCLLFDGCRPIVAGVMGPCVHI